MKEMKKQVKEETADLSFHSGFVLLQVLHLPGTYPFIHLSIPPLIHPALSIMPFPFHGMKEHRQLHKTWASQMSWPSQVTHLTSPTSLAHSPHESTGEDWPARSQKHASSDVLRFGGSFGGLIWVISRVSHWTSMAIVALCFPLLHLFLTVQEKAPMQDNISPLSSLSLVPTFLSFQIPWASLCSEDDFAVLRCWREDAGRFADQAVWGVECHIVQGQSTGGSHWTTADGREPVGSSLLVILLF